MQSFWCSYQATFTKPISIIDILKINQTTFQLKIVDNKFLLHNRIHAEKMYEDLREISLLSWDVCSVQHVQWIPNDCSTLVMQLLLRCVPALPREFPPPGPTWPLPRLNSTGFLNVTYCITALERGLFYKLAGWHKVREPGNRVPW